MCINFMKNSVTALRPVSVGYKEVERVRTYKLLEVIISDDLKWNAHIEYVIAETAKRLYALRLLKRAGVMPTDIPNSSYQQAQDLTNLTSLVNRRILLCKKLMADMRDESHPISLLVPQVTTRTIPYQLRSGSTTAPKTAKRTKRANDLFTFRFA